MSKVNINNEGKVSLSFNDDDLGSNKVSFKQNASGFWYVNELTINCISIIDGIELMAVAIEKSDKILKTRNIKSKL